MTYDAEFIKAETRCGWPVSTLMKKVWWVQLDLLTKMDEICTKHDLQWFCIWGTLLGAVRHHGFIPWDDDVDIVMPREDYERFSLIAEKELSSPYFLQTTLNDSECFYMWASLRNSETTGNRISCLSKKQNNGIGIDIMPLDGCESNPLAFQISRFPVRVASILANTYLNEFNMSMPARVLRKILRFTGFNYRKAYVWAENRNRKFAGDKYPKFTFRALADPNVKDISTIMWDKSDFQETIRMPFESITVPVPCGYDRILTKAYKNYMEFPPVEKRKGKHSVVFQPDIPYRQYCAEVYGVTYESSTPPHVKENNYTATIIALYVAVPLRRRHV